MSETEMITQQRSNLSQIDQLPIENPEFLKDLSEDLPGWLHLNSLDNLGLLWMSERMQGDLQISMDQVREQGSSFLEKIIHPESTRQVLPSILALRDQGDENQVISFIQMIRYNQHAPYRAHYTTVKISKKLNCYISQTVPLLGFEKQLHALTLSAGFDQARADQFIRFQSLTKREKEILGLIAAGNTNKSIADRLCISCWTVRTHRRNILKKLDTNRIQDLIKLARAFRL